MSASKAPEYSLSSGAFLYITTSSPLYPRNKKRSFVAQQILSSVDIFPANTYALNVKTTAAANKPLSTNYTENEMIRRNHAPDLLQKYTSSIFISVFCIKISSALFNYFFFLGSILFTFLITGLSSSATAGLFFFFTTLSFAETVIKMTMAMLSSI